VEIHYGDLFDDHALRTAMRDCDEIYHCAVDTRAWLRDPEPLFRTNIAGLRRVLDAACATGPRRFVFTSSAATIGRRPGGVADETVAFDWPRLGGPYVRSRVEAENLVLRYATERGLPAVAMCVANTYGPGDWQPTPHGSFVAAAALGRLPFRFAGTGSESVGVEDAARALILAGAAGQPGERYIVSDRFLTNTELLTAAAHAAGREPPRVAVPLPLLYPAAGIASAVARVRGRDSRFTVTSSCPGSTTARPSGNSGGNPNRCWTRWPGPRGSSSHADRGGPRPATDGGRCALHSNCILHTMCRMQYTPGRVV
jgi:dihydroflavonol-4-reductase